MKTKKQNKIIITSLLAIFTIVIFGAIHRNAQMARYALNNGCTWQYQGTFYGDDRDYICK